MQQARQKSQREIPSAAAAAAAAPQVSASPDEHEMTQAGEKVESKGLQDKGDAKHRTEYSAAVILEILRLHTDEGVKSGEMKGVLEKRFKDKSFPSAKEYVRWSREWAMQIFQADVVCKLATLRKKSCASTQQDLTVDADTANKIEKLKEAYNFRFKSLTWSELQKSLILDYGRKLTEKANQMDADNRAAAKAKAERRNERASIADGLSKEAHATGVRKRKSRTKAQQLDAEGGESDVDLSLPEDPFGLEEEQLTGGGKPVARHKRPKIEFETPEEFVGKLNYSRDQALTALKGKFDTLEQQMESMGQGISSTIAESIALQNQSLCQTLAQQNQSLSQTIAQAIAQSLSQVLGPQNHGMFPPHQPQPPSQQPPAFYQPPPQQQQHPFYQQQYF